VRNLGGRASPGSAGSTPATARLPRIGPIRRVHLARRSSEWGRIPARAATLTMPSCRLGAAMSLLRLVAVAAVPHLSSLALLTMSRQNVLVPARATLLVARIALHLTRTQSERVVLLPSKAPLPFDEAVRPLSEMKKPAICIAKAEGGTLALECAPFRPPATVPVRDVFEMHRIANHSFR
jgi:hypothetical protein